MKKIDYYTLVKWRAFFKEWEFVKDKSIIFMIGFNFARLGFTIQIDYGRHFRKGNWRLLAFTILILNVRLQVGYSFKRKEEKNANN